MGADLLFVIAPDLGADEYRRRIDALDPDDVGSIADELLGDERDDDEAREWLKGLVAEVADERRDTIRMELFGHAVIITAGMSWGDDPTDAWQAVCALSEVARLSGAGV
jgi:hypothetical protein